MAHFAQFDIEESDDDGTFGDCKQRAPASSSHPPRKVAWAAPILYSAWQPISDIAALVHARNPEMTEYKFTHITAVYETDGTVTFATLSETKHISIASDWAEGKEKWKEKEEYHKMGFIGQGFTKWVICVFSILLAIIKYFLKILILIEPVWRSWYGTDTDYARWGWQRRQRKETAPDRV